MASSGTTKATVVRLAKQSVIPLLLAAAYATWAFSESDGASATAWLTPFGGAFFLCSYFVGQYLRTAKQVGDSKKFSDIETGIADAKMSMAAGLADIKQSIADFKAVQVAVPHQGAPLSNHLFQQAKGIAQGGNVLAGLLQAGLAFEQAIHDKARRMGLDRREFRSLPELIARIERQLGPGAEREIQVLWKLRNQIVHADQEAVAELQRRPDLMSMFERGMELLDASRDDF